MNGEYEPQARGLVRWVMVGVLLWGVIAALGVARFDQIRNRFNPVKPIVVIAVTIAIVVVWRIALARRRHRAEPRDPQN